MRPMRSIGLYVYSIGYCIAVVIIVLTDSRIVEASACISIIISAYALARWMNSPPLSSIFVAVLAIATAFARMAFVPSTLPETFSPLIDEPDVLTGVVVSLPDLRETSQRITVEIKSGIQRTRIIASVPLYPSLHVGEKVRLSGTLKRPEPFATDGGRTFAYDQFLRKDGVFGVMQPANVFVIGTHANLYLRFLRMLQVVKDTLMRLFNTALPEPESSLASGLLIGGKQGLGDRLIDAFTSSGMLQIVVLSGYNVMIVADVLMRCLSRFPKKVGFSFGVSSIACFVLMAGAGSSALRAGLMAFFAITARTFGKQYDVMRALSASVLILSVWNPLMLVYDPGFQFSFIATLGLVLGTPIITPKLLFLRSTITIELVSTTLAAEIALLPFLLWQTGNLSLVSVFANVVTMPAVPYAMGASVLAGISAFIFGDTVPVLAIIAGIPAYLPLAYIIKVATLSASLPFAEVILPSFPFWIVLAIYAALALVVVRSRA